MALQKIFSFNDTGRLELQNIVQRGSKLQVIVDVTNHSIPFVMKTSPEMTINSAVKFHVMLAVACQYNTQTFNNLIFIRFNKIRNEDDLTYTITLSSRDLNIKNKTFHSDNGAWHLINENNELQYKFDINVVLDIVQCCTFATLYDDEDLMDFELRGENGAVRVHRAVLAASSPVLRRMLSGGWRETAEGHVDVPGTSKKTLQHLKDFMYLHRLPTTGLESILLLASYYMMEVLEQMCVDRLVNEMVAENACDLLQFGTKHRLTRLVLAVLDTVQNGAIKVHDMREHYMLTKQNKKTEK